MKVDISYYKAGSREGQVRKNHVVFSGTGFTPCNTCLNHSREFLLTYIAMHRDNRLKPFPDDSGLTELAEYVLKG